MRRCFSYPFSRRFVDLVCFMQLCHVPPGALIYGMEKNGNEKPFTRPMYTDQSVIVFLQQCAANVRRFNPSKARKVQPMPHSAAYIV